MLDQGLWLELVEEGGFNAVLSLQGYTFSYGKGMASREPNVTTTVTSIVPTTWLPLALSSRARSLTPFSP